MNVLETIPCPLCGSTAQSPHLRSRDFLLTREEFSMVRCKACDVLFTNPRVNEQHIGNYYGSNYVPYLPSKVSRLIRCYKWLFSRFYIDQHQKIARLLRKNGVRTVLELGPAYGRLLQYLHNEGFEVSGVEINDACVKNITGMGITCHKGTIAEVTGQLATYDAVIMCQVFEHIYDPKKTLEIIKSVLHEHGLLYLNVPNVDSFESRLFGRFWCGIDLPRHVIHFSRKTIEKLLRSSGFSVDTIKDMPFPSSFVESFGFLLAKNGRLHKLLYYPAYYVWKILSPLHVPLIGSGCIEVVARKQ